jgi:DNA-directed RNA polymerase specialized sigma24 family protein
MLMVELVDDYFYWKRLTPALMESEDPKIGPLAAAAVIGDGAALNKLMNHYARSLHGIAARYVGVDSAHDVVQDVFAAIVEGKFKHYAQKFATDGQTVTLILSRAVTNAASNKRKKLSNKELSGGGKIGGFADPDQGGLDPEQGGTNIAGASKGGGISTAERELVFTALARARTHAKLSPAENQFVDELFKTGYFFGTPDAPKLKEIAMKIWPDKTPNAAGAAATRAKDRFLKQLCLDPELKKFRVGTASSFSKDFEPLCAKFKEDVDPVVFMAVKLGLVEDVSVPDRDKAYAEVLRWTVALRYM